MGTRMVFSTAAVSRANEQNRSQYLYQKKHSCVRYYIQNFERHSVEDAGSERNIWTTQELVLAITETGVEQKSPKRDAISAHSRV